MNNADIEWDDIVVTYTDNKNYYQIYRKQTDLGKRLGNILDYIKSRSIHDHFFKQMEYDAICIPIQIASVEPSNSRWDTPDATIRIESAVISMEQLYKLLAMKVQDYISKNYSSPSIILIGNELQPAIADGKLPDSRFIIKVPGWYTTVYIPNLEKIIILGEDITNAETKR